VLALSFAINGSVSTTGAAGGPLGTTASLALCLSDGCNDTNVYSSLNGGAITQSTQPGFRSDATITFYVPFTYGTTFEIEPFLATQAQFIPGDGTPFTTTANFNSTAHLTSALVLGGTSNAPGSIVNGTAIGSDAGFTYGANGLVAGVPEPGTAWLATSGLGLVLLVSRLRNRKTRTIG
jgi:PEP-CTERM motif